MVSWGGGSDVTDISGNPVYKVKGRVLSIGRRKIMCDLEGNTLFVIRNRWFNPIRHKTYIKDAEGNRVATVYSKAFDLTRLYADTEKDNTPSKANSSDAPPPYCVTECPSPSWRGRSPWSWTHSPSKRRPRICLS